MHVQQPERLIEWTGERAVPWADTPQVLYEHLHRYWWAAELLRGRGRVLDLGCGEGYGSEILVSVVDEVVGVDIDDVAVLHARANHPAERLSFVTASATDLSAFSAGSFDVVVAFEMIEHVSEHEQVLSEIRRVLADDGLLVMSSPDRDVYSERSDGPNPFHARELTQAELEQLIAGHFGHHALWGQHALCGSHIYRWPPDSGPDSQMTIQVERRDGEWARIAETAPVYWLVLASDAALPELHVRSLLADHGLELLRAREREMAADAAAGAAAGEAAQQRAHEKSARDAADRIEFVRDQLGHALYEAAELRAEVNELRRIPASLGWRLVSGADRRLTAALPPNTFRGRLRALGTRRLRHRLAKRGPAGLAGHEPTDGATVFPVFDNPRVSIIVPVHSQLGLVRATLNAIEAHTHVIPYEVIVVDDASDPDTASFLTTVQGINLIVNERNQGYLQSNNTALERARGQHIVYLNSDTEVQEGWLERLTDVLESSEDVGVVGAKLRYPDGRLQEAGCVIYSDGSAGQVGKLEEPGMPKYNYVRDVDYCSAACILVRGELIRALGGFDTRYSPAYYEDTDLCMEARARGYRVVYQPAADVIHAEGGTGGTDTDVGVKRRQVRNHPIFTEKWRSQLVAEHQAPGTPVEATCVHGDPPIVLLADHKVPEWDRDSGSQRMWHILLALRQLGYRVVFLPHNGRHTYPYIRDLQQDGIEVLGGPFSVEERLNELGPVLHAAFVSRPDIAATYLPALRRKAPGAALVFDTVDLHYVRERRRAEVTGDRSASASSAALREIELAIIRSADATLVVTDAEREILTADAPSAEIHVVPNANAVYETTPGPDGRKGLLFVGGFEHPPNGDAAVFLVEEVMPRVWDELPSITVDIVGSDPPPEVQALASARVRVRGWVKNLVPLLDSARVSVAPLRYGAGMKGKVTQSLAHGLPVATTSLGAEGLPLEDNVSAMIADEPEALAQRIVRLYHEDVLWQEIADAGKQVAADTVSPAGLEDRLDALLTSVTGQASPQRRRLS